MKKKTKMTPNDGAGITETNNTLNTLINRLQIFRTHL